MKVKIRKAHKSIPSDIEFEVPPFAVLTGGNGSGKTHLFEAISDKENGEVHVSGKRLKAISYLPFGALNPQVDQRCDPSQISQKVKLVWQELEQGIIQVKRRNQILPIVQRAEEDEVIRHMSNQQHRDAVLGISKKIGVMPCMFTEDIIADHISMADLSGSNLFNSQFALIFKAYHVHVLDNKLNKVYEEEGIKDAAKYLKGDEFKEKFGGAPWEFVDSILERLCLPYKVNNPMGSKRDSTFVFKLVNKITGLEISTNDLSTGEKTLMSLALAIYNTTGIGDRAEMLILDEPDAPLHPSMSKLMLEILEEEIVKKHNIPVLISTHSPTTIACAPANSLYKISANEKSPIRCDLQDSMRILMYGIPNLRVSTERRRQVFVEHRYDVEYLELLFDVISRRINFNVVPQFLPPHNLNGSNCEAVLEITRKLRDMGNSQVYGLIDWDLKNAPEPQVIVLGMGRRYAIENYIFEPHLMGLYLIYKKFVSPSELGLSDCGSYLEACNKIAVDVGVVQAMADSVDRKISWNEVEGARESSRLIDGWSVNIRRELFTIRGHDLEDKYKKAWPQLNSIRTNNDGDSALKKDVINTVINDFPGLVSQDIVDTMNEII